MNYKAEQKVSLNNVPQFLSSVKRVLLKFSKQTLGKIKQFYLIKNADLEWFVLSVSGNS